jgi:multidrug efflux pump subunit AcrA (membrane-fusion protein)
VKLGMEREGRVQVLDGLAAGEQVVGRGAVFVDNESRS